MYTLYPQHHYHNSPYHYFDEEDSYRDSYYRALAAERARERQEAQYRAQLQETLYRAQLEDALRRRVYQEQLARAQEANRNRRAAYSPFMGRFDLQDDYEPYSSFHVASDGQNDHNNYLGDIIDQQVVPPRRRSMTNSRSPRRNESAKLREFPKQTTRSAQHIPFPNPTVREQTPPPTQQAKRTAPKPDTRDAAARKLQSFFRALLPRLKALNAISVIERQFEKLISQFTFPSTLDFSESATTPILLYTPRNAPLHGHDHALVKLLSKLDAVESHGDESVRKTRKQLVNRIERELAALDEKKIEAWKALQIVSLIPITVPESPPPSEDADMAGAVVSCTVSDVPTVVVADASTEDDDSGCSVVEMETEAKEEKVVDVDILTEGGDGCSAAEVEAKAKEEKVIEDADILLGGDDRGYHFIEIETEDEDEKVVEDAATSTGGVDSGYGSGEAEAEAKDEKAVEDELMQ